MNTPTIRTLVALDSGVDSHAVETAFPIGSPVHLVGVVEGFDSGWAVLEESSPDLLVVACAGYSERALFMIEGAVKQSPDRPVVVFYFGSPDGFMLRAFEAGADDLVSLPASAAEVELALKKAVARRRRSADAATVNPLVCILGPKGGTGKTLTVCNLAVALAQRGKRPAIVDLDLQFGDVGMALGLAPDQTIHDLARVGGTLDPGKVDDFLAEHPSGARALLAPSRPDQASVVTVEFLAEAYSALRAGHDFVVVDTPPGFTPEVIATIDASSDLVVVGMLDALSLKDTRLGLETLELMGYPQERIKLVLNRADSNIGISREEAETILGRKPDVFVPSDREIPRAMTHAQPIVVADESCEAARAFHQLAELFIGSDTTSTANGNGNGNGFAERSALAILRRIRS
jgi:pilus assembly protein CpaE